MSKSVAEVKAALLDLKRSLTLDMPDSDVPQNEIDSAHYWNAVAQIDQAINSLTLTQTMRHVVALMR